VRGEPSHARGLPPPSATLTHVCRVALSLQPRPLFRWRTARRRVRPASVRHPGVGRRLMRARWGAAEGALGGAARRHNSLPPRTPARAPVPHARESAHALPPDKEKQNHLPTTTGAPPSFDGCGMDQFDELQGVQSTGEAGGRVAGREGGRGRGRGRERVGERKDRRRVPARTRSLPVGPAARPLGSMQTPPDHAHCEPVHMRIPCVWIVGHDRTSLRRARPRV